jgi:hypothetical protein
MFSGPSIGPCDEKPQGLGIRSKAFPSSPPASRDQGQIAAIGLSVAKDKLVFSMRENAGNIWLGTMEQR